MATKKRLDRPLRVARRVLEQSIQARDQMNHQLVDENKLLHRQMQSMDAFARDLHEKTRLLNEGYQTMQRTLEQQDKEAASGRAVINQLLTSNSQLIATLERITRDVITTK